MKSDAPTRIIGVIAGAALGVLAYWLALRSAYHILVAVAVAPGIAGGLAARRRSFTWGVVIAIVSLALTLVIEWLFLPFAADASFAYFLTHLDALPTKSQLSLVAALGVGLYFGMGRNPKNKARGST